VEGWPSTPPVLIAEVMDEQADYSYIMNRIPVYLRFGIDMIWIVDPGSCVRVFRLKDQKQSFAELCCEVKGPASDSLEGGDVLPGFTFKVADFFE
jgi:Uma2 family endonuclease